MVACRCTTCPYWDDPRSGRRGRCRRSAPRALLVGEAEPTVLAAWPETDGDADWCGDHPDLAAVRRRGDRAGRPLRGSVTGYGSTEP